MSASTAAAGTRNQDPNDRGLSYGLHKKFSVGQLLKLQLQLDL
jgi:hypothetical protein